MKKQIKLAGFVAAFIMLMAGNVNAQWDRTGTNTYLTNSGDKVGIGLTSPSYKLHVYTSSNTNLNSRTAYFKNAYTGSSSKYGVYSDVTSNGSGNKFGVYATVTDNSSTNATGILGEASGAFGAGTGGSNIGVKGIANGGVNTNSYGVWGVTLGVNNTDCYGVYGTASGGSNNWAGYFEGKGYFSDSVGIGKSSPEAKLHVKSGTTERPFQVEVGNATKMKISYNGGTTIGYGSTIDPPADGLRIKGNVSIGTTIDTYELNVCGTIKAEELRLETGWCDYVFADNYQLRPLKEVSDFIKLNKHLPDIEPALKVETEGLKVAEMSSKMMLKIEELTLYILQLNERIESLEKENLQLINELK